MICEFLLHSGLIFVYYLFISKADYGFGCQCLYSIVINVIIKTEAQYHKRSYFLTRLISFYLSREHRS